jgi:hypothetical protein
MQALEANIFEVGDRFTTAFAAFAQANSSGVSRNLTADNSFFDVITTAVSKPSGDLPRLASIRELINITFPLLTPEQSIAFTESGIAFSLLDLLSCPNTAIRQVVCESQLWPRTAIT